MNSNPRKILLISQVFYPDQVAVSNLFTKLFERIAEKDGYRIDVWCAQPSYTTRERQPKYLNHKGLNIFYLPSANFSKNKLWGRVLNVLSFSFSVICKLIFSRSKDLILVHTTPPFLAILVIAIARFKKRRVVYILMDIFPDGLVRLGRASLKNPIISIWKRLHTKALMRAERVITIGRDMASWVMDEVPGIDANKLLVIPLWQDERQILPIQFEANPFVIKYKLKDDFIVQFSGNMGFWNDLETIGKAVARGIDGVKYVFIGDGIRKKELLSAMGNKTENAIFLPFLSNDEYAYSVTACHCGLVTLRHEALGMGVPSKIFGIMAAGIPVLAIAPKNSEIALIVKESECGLVVEPGDIDGLVNSISFLKENGEVRNRMGLNARKSFEMKYTTTKGVHNYLTLFNELL
jgi:glycosyltransferase involved in cell wall biosynthesis